MQEKWTASECKKKLLQQHSDAGYGDNGGVDSDRKRSCGDGCSDDIDYIAVGRGSEADRVVGDVAELAA